MHVLPSCFVPDLLHLARPISFVRTTCRLRWRGRGGPEEEPPTSNILSILIIKSHSHTFSVYIEGKQREQSRNPKIHRVFIWFARWQRDERFVCKTRRKCRIAMTTCPLQRARLLKPLTNMLTRMTMCRSALDSLSLPQPKPTPSKNQQLTNRRVSGKHVTLSMTAAATTNRSGV